MPRAPALSMGRKARLLGWGGASLVVGAFLAWLIKGPLIALAYFGHGPRFVTAQLTGRDTHALSHYLDHAASLAMGPIIVVAAAGAALMALAWSRHDSRAILAQDAAGLRALLAGTAAIASTAVLLALNISLEGWQNAGARGDDAAGMACPDGPEARPAPQFSARSGFYDQPFDLTIDADAGGAVFYTLDGSTPDPADVSGSTVRYEGPIPVIDRTGEPASLALIDTTAVGRTPFFDDEDRAERFGMPDLSGQTIEQAMVVRARTACSATRTATFFVGEERVRAELPVLSLATDPDGLMDYDSGIYVAGRLLDESVQSDDFDPGAGWIVANYTQRGREWERQVALDFCLPGGECIYDREAGIRLHGRYSRSFPQKSVRLYARNDYGDRRFRANFFLDTAPVPSGHRRLILRNSGNDNQSTMLADGALQSLLIDLKAGTQAYQPAVVFLNGEYWGIHNIRERYDRHYLETVYGADPDAVDFLNNSGSTDGMPDDLLTEWGAWLDGLQDTDPADQAFVAEVEAHLDPESFFDFIIGHVFVGNSDWVSNNVRWWREPDGPDRPGDGVRDGRWRWLISDFDQWGRAQGDPEYNNFTDRLAPTDDPRYRDGFPFLFHRMTANEGWRNQFLNRFADLLNTSLRPAETLAKLEEAATRIASEIPRHLARWRPEETSNDWNDDIERMASFLEARPSYQRQQLADLFGLEGTGTLTIAGETGLGAFRVNTITLPASALGPAGSWTGIYFQDVPVTIEAKPAPGYRFGGWEGTIDEASEPVMTIIPGRESINLRASFVAE